MGAIAEEKERDLGSREKFFDQDISVLQIEISMVNRRLAIFGHQDTLARG